MRIAFFVLVVSILFGCNKNSTTSFTISGQINDSKSGLGLSNVSIKVYEQTSTGVNSGTELIATGTSNSDGSYSVDFPRNLVESYYITYSKEGYFTEEITRGFEDFRTDQDNEINIQQRPGGWIRFIIQNIGTVDPQDQMKIYKESGTQFCPDCCADGFYYFDGPNIDTTWTCQNVAQEYFVFRYWDVLAPSYTFDSVLIQQNDTIDYLIQY